MQLLFDDLTATLMLGVILLMLVAVSLRSQEAQVEAVTFETFRTHQVAFIQMLQRDLAGMTCDEENGIPCPTQGADAFTFYTRLGDDPAEREVVYKRRKVGERDGVDLYQIQRYVDPTACCDPDDYDGGSLPTLTAWSVAFLNEAEQEVTDGSNAVYVHIGFEAIAPLDEEPPFERRRWEATFRPRMLQRDQLKL